VTLILKSGNVTFVTLADFKWFLMLTVICYMSANIMPVTSADARTSLQFITVLKSTNVTHVTLADFGWCLKLITFLKSANVSHVTLVDFGSV
jgi:hypothetical protein